VSGSLQPPFRPERPALDVIDLANALLKEELPGFEIAGAFSSVKPTKLLPKLGPLAVVVMGMVGDDLLQVLAREDSAEPGWTALSLDTVPSWLALDGDQGLATRVTGVEQGALEVRYALNGQVYDVPVLNERLCLVEWGVENKPDSPWPQAVAIRRDDGWHDPVLPGIYITERGLVDSYPLTDDPTEKQLVASLYLDAAIAEEPRRALKLIRLIVGRADDDQLGLIGAGPLEELVIAHGERLVDEIKRIANVDERFRKALAAAWVSRASKRVRNELAEFYSK
jgi:hypothetical protein